MKTVIYCIIVYIICKCRKEVRRPEGKPMNFLVNHYELVWFTTILYLCKNIKRNRTLNQTSDTTNNLTYSDLCGE